MAGISLADLPNRGKAIVLHLHGKTKIRLTASQARVSQNKSFTGEKIFFFRTIIGRVVGVLYLIDVDRFAMKRGMYEGAIPPVRYETSPR